MSWYDWRDMYSKPSKEELLYQQFYVCGVDTYPRIRVQLVNPRAHKKNRFSQTTVFCKQSTKAWSSSMPRIEGLSESSTWSISSISVLDHSQTAVPFSTLIPRAR